MKILVIGNGFDLALGLPTKYTDFLNFTKIMSFTYNQTSYTNNTSIIQCLSTLKRRIQDLPNAEIKNEIDSLLPFFMKFEEAFKCDAINRVFKDFHYCIYKNSWLNYFQHRYDEKLFVGENWIDFEREIKLVIQLLEDNLFEIQEAKLTDVEINALNNLDLLGLTNLLRKNRENNSKYRMTTEGYNLLRGKLRNDFDKFLMALGIYLDFFVKKYKSESKVSRDIYRMVHNDKEKVDCVLSFNYINNFNLKYSGELQSDENTCYIHGMVDYDGELKRCLNAYGNIDDSVLSIDSLIRKNTMIIGVDEYLNDEERNEFLDFVYYRKYFQRISKGTGSQYLEWLDKYKTNKENMPDGIHSKANHVVVFGHSLDVTDKDIFRDLMLREPNDTKVTIYYHDEDAHERIIENLIRILTQEVLIKKTHGSNPDIEFKMQSDWD